MGLRLRTRIVQLHHQHVLPFGALAPPVVMLLISLCHEGRKVRCSSETSTSHFQLVSLRRANLPQGLASLDPPPVRLFSDNGHSGAVQHQGVPDAALDRPHSIEPDIVDPVVTREGLQALDWYVRHFMWLDPARVCGHHCSGLIIPVRPQPHKLKPQTLQKDHRSGLIIEAVKV